MIWDGKIPVLYPILDAAYLESAEDRAEFLRRTVKTLADAGVGIMQYRNKLGDEREILADARVMRDAADGRMLLILNDRPELVMDAGFDGVHVGQTDVSPLRARGMLGSDAIVGVSTHNDAQLRAADREPVDYIAIGPVFATTTKANPDPIVGVQGVQVARALTAKPLVAIGGITGENAAAVRRAGADSLAVVSAIFSLGVDVAKSVRELERLLPGRKGLRQD